MNKIDTIKLSTRVFKTNPLRTCLTVLGIGVGIGAILFLVSLGFGLQRLLLNQISNSDSLLSLDVYVDSSSLLEFDGQNITKMKNITGVENVSPRLSLKSQMDINNLSGTVDLDVVDPLYFSLAGIKLSSGRFFNNSESGKIIVTSGVLKAFDIDENDKQFKAVNFKAYLSEEVKDESGGVVKNIKEVDFNKDFEIVGVVDNDFVSHAYVSLTDFSHLNIPKYSSVKIKVNKQENVEEVRKSVNDLGFSVSALSDAVEEVNKVFYVIQIILSLFGAVALIVSAIGMFNTMTIALLERTKEIGIMKSLGASSSDVWKLFLVESVLIGFLGGLSGVLIGVLASSGFNFLINRVATMWGGAAVSLFYTPVVFVVIIIVFSTVVGGLTGLYPSRRAAKLNALDALRYK